MRGVRRALLVLTGFLFLPVFLPADAPGDPVAITGVKVIPVEEYGKPLAELEINSALKIREIEITGAGETLDLRFPVYISTKKRVYPQVRLLTRQAAEAARRAVATRRTDSVRTPALCYEISSLQRFRRSSALKALGTVRFNGAVEVECKIMGGRNGLWVAWPARKPKGGGQWIKQVFITDERLRTALEKELLAAYDRMCAEEGVKD